jgi:hypothetical protein
MNRLTFLKGLGLTAVAAPSLVLSEITHSNKSELIIYESFLRGTYYYDMLHVFDKISINDMLILKREPTNKYDYFAIEVYFGSTKLGYLPAYENVVIANLLDAGKELKAYVYELEDSTSVPNLAVQVFLAN